MTQNENNPRRGMFIVRTFCVLLLLLDLIPKSILLMSGSLKLSQIIGSILTITLVYFLWRGSNKARWLTVFFLSLAFLFSVWLGFIYRSDQVVLILSIGFGVFSAIFVALFTSKMVSAFVIPPNKALKAQPSAAGEAASGAP